MRVPLPWLREYCDPALEVGAIEERLTMTGTKVEAVLHHGVPSAEGFVVGRVLSAEPHPDADRLKVCAVELGLADGPATIVCGAPNVAAGQTVAVALPGAVMPDGTTLKRARLRGVASEGMILAEHELQLDAGPSPGIMVLDGTALAAASVSASSSQMDDDAPPPGELAPGAPLAALLPIASDVLELEITPNRPDCLGVYGVARELHAATGAALAPAPWLRDPGSAGPVAGAAVTVECPELCPRFTARAFEHVTVAPSPPWLKARLSAAGQRPINNVVDITNYAMLLTGQPLHAFDLDRVAGGGAQPGGPGQPGAVGRLTVRRARDGEQLQTLDGHTRTLDREMVVIDDAEGPTSIAAIMGGARSEVHAGTSRVLMEVACWSGPNVHRTSWALGLRSEASSRFEKGLQPEQCMHAQAIASRLMVELCGATLVPGTIDVAGSDGAGWTPPPPTTLRLREARLRAILGVSVERSRQAEILAALDFASTPAADGLDVTVPALRRGDVTREIDLIEEVARIDGLERLPATLPARRGAAGRLSHAQRVRRRAEDALVGRGLHEIVGWSFAAPELLERLQVPPQHPLHGVVELENPLSDAQSIMRPTLLGSLLDAARHNVSRGHGDVAIFESGTVYRLEQGEPGEPGAAPPAGARADGRPRAEPGIREHHGLGVLLSGRIAPRSWRATPASADFFAAKALLAALLEHFHLSWWVTPGEAPFLHPGRSAAVLALPAAGGERAGRAPAAADGAGQPPPAAEPLLLGLLGELHPLVAERWELERAAGFLIDLGQLAAAAPAELTFSAFGAFPVLNQDLAVTLPIEVPAERLLGGVRRAGGEMLDRASVFDVYEGEQVGDGRRSLALALSFRSLERTLTDEDVEPVRARILAAVQELGGELRG
ncbi:MAG TPA: phenylalanine--tRNA ligase subunit beta [Solirubrobacteraceae bacterium]|nr:phenylalanine--tRNA ligase subunit beta [Solirubrobacteraceae bacterium]